MATGSSMTRKSRLFGQADRILTKTATAVAVAAGAGVVGNAPEAYAQVVSSGPVNIVIPLTTDGIYLNVVTGTTGLTGGATAGWDVNPYSGSSLSWYATTANANGYVRSLGTSTTAIDNLAPGTVISATSPNADLGTTQSSTGASEASGATAFNFNSSNNYVGFRFLNELTGATNYGWLQVSLGASFTDPARSIVAYSYESSGAPIVVPVPEPASLGLLSLGAVGLIARRRMLKSVA